ncbi:MAG: sulfatase-like hydrolase/transferase [Alphaproteobacteria bacterium]|nr:sulfatase-like hydrolase/transferase [Alphaproteobacteria bacterium]
MSDRPNLLVVMTDQQRTDTVGCLGGRHVRTPGIDRLAARGILFERAFTPVPMCSPARASLWTGLYPHGHGVEDNVYRIPRALPQGDERTVFGPLRRAGYRLAYVGKWHLGEADPGLFDLWDGYNSLEPQWLTRPDGARTYRSFAETDRAAGFLGGQKEADRPFCLVVSYYPPHPPYDPPAEYRALAAASPLPGYFGAVAAIDACVVRLLDALDASGLAGRTAIVFCSDHAQLLALRDGPNPKRNLYDETVRIPMILALPGGRAAGTRTAALVSLLDVTPTLLALAGPPPPQPCHGASLLPFADGGSPPWRDAFLLQNTTRPEHEAKRMARRERGLRTAAAKLVVAERRMPALYDLDADPEERCNLLAGESPQRERARDLALRMRAAAEAVADPIGLAAADAMLRRG